MTLIASYINKFGVVIASDSNLTSRQGNSGFGQKVFPIPFLNAGIAYSGLYEINGKDIDDWMNEFIINGSFSPNTIEEFVNNLTRLLNADFKGQSDDVAIMHICGYSKIDFRSHLEHWHISNSNLQNDGRYKSKGRFEYYNDFNSRLNLNQRELLQMFDARPENHQFYINGFPPARISLVAIKNELDELLSRISSQASWSFRPPKNIFETSNRVKLYFTMIGEIFKMSDYEALYVGGETQIYLIPAPFDLLKE